MFDVDDVEDVKRFATDISKQIKLRNNNEVVGKEKNAIKQVVWKILGGRKYELDKVLNNNEVNREYYAQTTNVLGGKVKGISNFSENKDFQNIAERIYQVRNLVVHSTEASMGRGYQPYVHASELAQEIKLVKSLAEMAIIYL
ncbi:hypothetical protein [Weissella confusa]|uniref:hypothetical protein n=1 Tax=Weissella confusa TaxID=1583 RepID=UPI0011604516|nr:hypothetical protein [Weissella confusa]